MLEGLVPGRIVARRKNGLIFLTLDEVWAIEAANRLAFVHTPFGRFDLDLTLASIEAICGPLLMRVHRNWLVNVAHVRELGRDRGATTLYLGIGSARSGKGVCAPVARERARHVRDALLSTAAGIRRPDPGTGPWPGTRQVPSFALRPATTAAERRASLGLQRNFHGKFNAPFTSATPVARTVIGVMRRAFVLQLASQTRPRECHFEGSVEEVDTGRELLFRSTDELMAFLGQCFEAAQHPDHQRHEVDGEGSS